MWPGSVYQIPAVTLLVQARARGQVTTEEQIMFTFKSFKKSNNGTDVNAGQIPQLLYRIVAPERVQCLWPEVRTSGTSSHPLQQVWPTSDHG